MVSIMTPCIYWVKKCAWAKQNTIWQFYITVILAGLAVHFTNRTNGKALTNWETDRTLFPSIQLTLADHLILSVPDLSLLCSTQRRGIREFWVSACICLSVCRAVYSGHALFVAWQLLWAPNNAPPANKWTQLTIHGTSYRHIVQSVEFASLHREFSCTLFLSLSHVSVLLLHFVHLSPISSLASWASRSSFGLTGVRQAFGYARWSW